MRHSYTKKDIVFQYLKLSANKLQKLTEAGAEDGAYSGAKPWLKPGLKLWLKLGFGLKIGMNLGLKPEGLGEKVG